MKRKSVILSLIVFLFYNLMGQQEVKMSMETYNREKETILNTVINSVQFDCINSIYSDSSLYFVFAENEILYKDIPISLTYKNQKVEIVDCSKTNEKCYWVGDFFLNIYIENSKEATTQITLVRKNKEEVLFGIILEKGKKWEIKSFTLIE